MADLPSTARRLTTERTSNPICPPLSAGALGYNTGMACLLVAAWTWVIAWVSLGDRPGWALIFAAMGGFAVGALLMIVVYEDQRGRGSHRHQPGRVGRLKVVRAASATWGNARLARIPAVAAPDAAG